jgi:Spy/CpxP family protein refolding chaperone
MKALVQRVLTFGLVVVLCGGVVAQEKGEKKRKKKDKAAATQVDRSAAAFQLPKEIQLTDEQNAKLQELRKDLQPKLAALLKKEESMLTAEQRAAGAAAAKEAKQSGKTGKEAREAVEAAMKLSPEQQANYRDLQREMGQMRKEIAGRIASILTPEQREKLNKGRGEGKPKKPKN